MGVCGTPRVKLAATFALQEPLREAAQRIDLSRLLLCLSCFPEGLAYEAKHATLR
jgi:hypothetical protein